MTLSVGFIGVGAMASAIVRGLIKQRQLYSFQLQINLYNRRDTSHFTQFKLDGCQVATDLISLIKSSQVIFLGVKPNDMTALLTDLVAQAQAAQIDLKDKVFISMAAGYSIVNMTALLGTDQVGRIMPNTPITVGKGIVGIYTNPAIDPAIVVKLQELFTKASTLVVLDQEQDINSIIAVSGSGPAYFFNIFNAMVEMAVNQLEMPPQQAKQLVLETAAGAIELAQQSDLSLLELQQAVTSKGGTTAAALAVFAEHGLDQIISQAMAACYKRSEEMQQLNNL